jgi:hypothetical protein
MEKYLSISSEESLENLFLVELTLLIQNNGGKIFYEIPNINKDHTKSSLRNGAVSPSDLLVTIGSAGVFTAIYQTISSFLMRNQNRELTLSRGEQKITIKGHSLPEEKALLKLLAPEFLSDKKDSAKLPKKKLKNNKP